jgi:hypothetical protein
VIIDKGIEMPMAHNIRCAYAFHRMEVGDSFEVPYGGDIKGTCNRVCAAASRWGRLHKKKFTTRRTEAGIRVWRTA